MPRSEPHFYFIPVLSSQAGSCLTLDNWQAAGFSRGVYYLESLLSKPGLDVLLGARDLKNYTGWTGTLILNAAISRVSSLGEYIVRSPYDGSTIKIGREDLLQLIAHLRADYVIWPETLGALSKARECAPISVFLAPGMNQLADKTFYYKMDPMSDEALQADFKAELLACLVTQAQVGESAFYFESDRPAMDALQGRVYCQTGSYLILASQYEQDFSVLEERCLCRTCQQGLTRAYLHHLLQKTPLLAQRFLVEHNIHWCLQLIRDLGFTLR